MNDLGAEVTIAGAGPTGALLAILLRRRGLRVRIYESRPDPRGRQGESGRSINLALADRGIAALRQIGVFAAIERFLVPMSGRLIHDLQGGTSLQAYGARSEEVIYSISRHRLNQVLLDMAVREHGVEVSFQHRLEETDLATGIAQFRDMNSAQLVPVAMTPLLACDGAGSIVRRQLHRTHRIEAVESPLDHGYKELSIPSGPGGAYRMAREALHIWPRGEYMLIALPNDDGSFTATLFLANTGARSFANLTRAEEIEAFLRASFPDAVALMPDCVEEFQRHPTGFLGTVRAQPWSTQGLTTLIGDAAHAIVPFHGQGMNCCFEDCVEFDSCLAVSTDWESCFREFYARRKPNTDAIAAMALENYLEMRDQVSDVRFQLQHAVSLELERRYPDRFIPRYSMVMFHHEIPYSVAERRGLVQTRLLDEITTGVTSLADVDFARAGREILAQLPSIGDSRKSVTNE